MRWDLVTESTPPQSRLALDEAGALEHGDIARAEDGFVGVGCAAAGPSSLVRGETVAFGVGNERRPTRVAQAGV